MKKIPTLFIRDKNDMSRVTNEVNPECEWVLAGEGRPTRKWDGSAVALMIPNDDGEIKAYKRYTVKRGREAPDFFLPATEPDPNTGKQEGWVPVDADDPADQYHVEALLAMTDPVPGTYELVGPKVNGGRDGNGETHELRPHGGWAWDDDPRTFAEIAESLTKNHGEGIVWHHEDGRMAKIKRRDFGLPW